MKFNLVKNKSVTFIDLPSTIYDKIEHFIKRQIVVDARLQLAETEQDGQSKRDFELFKNLLASNTLEGTSAPKINKVTEPLWLPKGAGEFSDGPEKLNRSLLVTVGMSDEAAHKNFVKLTDAPAGNLIKRMKDITKSYGVRFEILICFENLSFPLKSNGSKRKVLTCKWDAVGNLEQHSSRRRNSEGYELRFFQTKPCNHWFRMYEEYQVNLSISCIAYPAKTLSIFTSLSTTSFKTINQRILEEEVRPDVTIRTQDDTEIKCHQSFLSVQSDVLGINFTGDFAESKTNVIEMSDMSTPAVKAFLSYLYYFDLEKALASSEIAFEVFQASHKYNVTKLYADIKNVLVIKPDDWYTVEVALDLFLFARKLGNEVVLKARAVKIIKKNYASFKASPKYKELVRDNLEAFEEFTEIGFVI